MSEPYGLDIVAQRALLRLSGPVPPAEAVARITQAIRCCRERRIRALLVDVSGITGLEAWLTPAARFLTVKAWAEAAHGTVGVALVLPREMIDPGHLGMTAAANRGMRYAVFETESKAAAWLDAAQTRGKRESAGSAVSETRQAGISSIPPPSPGSAMHGRRFEVR